MSAAYDQGQELATAISSDGTHAILAIPRASIVRMLRVVAEHDEAADIAEGFNQGEIESASGHFAVVVPLSVFESLCTNKCTKSTA